MSACEEPLLQEDNETSGWQGYLPFRWRFSRTRSEADCSVITHPDNSLYRDHTVDDGYASTTAPSRGETPPATLSADSSAPTSTSSQQQSLRLQQPQQHPPYHHQTHLGGLSQSFLQQQFQQQSNSIPIQDANPYLRHTPSTNNLTTPHPTPATFITIPAPMVDRGYHHRQQLARSLSTHNLIHTAAQGIPSSYHSTHFNTTYHPSTSVPAPHTLQPASWASRGSLQRTYSSTRLHTTPPVPAPDPQPPHHHYLLHQHHTDPSEDTDAPPSTGRSSTALLASSLTHNPRSSTNLAQRYGSLRSNAHSFSQLPDSPEALLASAAHSPAGYGTPLLRHVPSHVSLVGSLHSACGYPMCLICLEPLTPEEFDKGEAMQLQCCCIGEVGMRHRACAVRWSQVRGNTICDICRAPIVNLPAVQPLPQQAPQDEQEGRVGGLVWEPPAAADYIFDFIRVTWVAMIVCILFWDCDMTGAFLVGGVVGLLYTSVAKAVHDCRRRRRGAQQQVEQRLQDRQVVIPGVIMV